MEMNSPRGVNRQTKRKLGSDRHGLHPDIQAAVKREIGRFGRKSEEDEQEGDEEDEPEDFKGYAECIITHYEHFFDERLDIDDPRIRDVVVKAIRRCKASTGGCLEDTFQLLMKVLTDWLEWTDKDNLQIKPGHLCSDEVWDRILPMYLERHPTEKSKYGL